MKTEKVAVFSGGTRIGDPDVRGSEGLFLFTLWQSFFEKQTQIFLLVIWYFSLY